MSTKRKQSLTDLPAEVLIEILERLPLSTLFFARSVCKTFLSLTRSSNAAAQTIVFFDRSYLLRFTDLDLKSSQLKPLFQLPKLDSNKLFLANSCNGLLYLTFDYRPLTPGYYPSIVCNPVTSEYIIIPDDDPEIRLKSLWLGFSPVTNQYKVLRISYLNYTHPEEVEAQLFVIGSDSWRDIDDTPPCKPYFYFYLCPALVNGLMYWYYHSWSVVISFDFETEKFGEIGLPAGFIANHYTSIGVLGGCLCLSFNDFEAHRVDLWVMRNQDSWSKEFVVDTGVLGSGGPVHFPFKPLQFLRNGQVLMLWRSDTLVYYDPRTRSLRHFKLDGANWNCMFVGLRPSFVPLKDTLGVESDKVLRPREG